MSAYMMGFETVAAPAPPDRHRPSNPVFKHILKSDPRSIAVSLLKVEAKAPLPMNHGDSERPKPPMDQGIKTPDVARPFRLFASTMYTPRVN